MSGAASGLVFFTHPSLQQNLELLPKNIATARGIILSLLKQLKQNSKHETIGFTSYMSFFDNFNTNDNYWHDCLPKFINHVIEKETLQKVFQICGMLLGKCIYSVVNQNVLKQIKTRPYYLNKYIEHCKKCQGVNTHKNSSIINICHNIIRPNGTWFATKCVTYFMLR